MKKQIIIFRNQRDLIIIIKRVIEKMKSNPVFPNSPAALAELEKALQFLRSLIDRSMQNLHHSISTSYFLFGGLSFFSAH